MICSTAPIIWFLSEFNVRNRRSFQSRPIGKRSRSSENSLDNPSRHHSVMKSWFCDLKGRPFFLARDNCSHRVHLPSWPKIIFLGDLVFCLWYALCDGWLLRSHYSKRLGPLWSAFFENFFSSKLPNFWKSCNFTDSFLITVSFMNTQSSSFNLANRDLHGGGGDMTCDRDEVIKISSCSLETGMNPEDSFLTRNKMITKGQPWRSWSVSQLFVFYSFYDRGPKITTLDILKSDQALLKVQLAGVNGSQHFKKST